MRFKRILLASAVALAVAMGLMTQASAPASAQKGAAVAIDNDDIGGVVTSPKGPESGVWVIAETRDLPTRYTKSVVTDDQGRYVIPDLPKAKYKVWVRGYGLVDSQKVDAAPGQQLNLSAVLAKTDAEAAKYYPAIYWYSMLKIPPKSDFGGSSDIPAKIKWTDWMNAMTNNGCIGCHQLGQLSTRTIPKSLDGQYSNHAEAWVRRVSSGQSGAQMVNLLAGNLGGVPFRYFGDWTERVAKGELPHTKPKRPVGQERNVVVTTWDWGEEDRYLHDLIASDRRFPTVNAHGKLYGSPEYSTDRWPILDPKTHTVTYFQAPVSDPNTTVALGPGHAASETQVAPSPYWGTKITWDTKTNNHNAMFDRHGRVWFAARGRPGDNPAFCQKGSDHPSAKAFPVSKSNRQLSMLDPKTGKYTFVDTCFQTHHLQFGYDANDTLWTSSGGGTGVVGWLNLKMYTETGDAAKSQGWTPLIMDTNGDGKRGEYTRPNQPFDAAKDRMLQQVFYAVMPNPADGSVWGTIRNNPGAVVRLMPGSDPTHTALAENYNVPLPGFGPRGGDIDSKGVVWVSLASGHLGSFDRSKCKGPLNGPKATGDHCPEGWSFHQYPGPGFQGIGPNSAESSYYTWVDQHNTFGLGRDVPMSTANLMDGLVAFVNGEMISLRVPYPLGFYAKGFDGRIDDENGGWKGRGLWTSSGDRTPWLVETGKGSLPMVVHFQLRPDPLAH
jgi:hypothetical protein